jgi:hypothetical protein
LVIALGLLMPAAVANAQGTSDTPSETWGDKEKPENYVASKGPADDGESYNWLQMGYASVVIVGMVGFMIWLVRRTPRKSLDDDAKNED